jgi:hypothetical protein
VAPIIAGAAVVSEGGRSSGDRPVPTEVVGATDAGLQLLGGDVVEDPGRLLVGLVVLEGIRLVDDDLVLRASRGTIGRQVKEQAFSRSIRISNRFIGDPGRIGRERLSRVLFRVLGTTIQWTAVEVVVAGTAVVVTALPVDTAPVSRGHTGHPEKA